MQACYKTFHDEKFKCYKFENYFATSGLCTFNIKKSALSRIIGHFIWCSAFNVIHFIALIYFYAMTDN